MSFNSVSYGFVHIFRLRNRFKKVIAADKLEARMSFYLYRFIDAEEKIIYIGRTNDIRRRILKEHFSDNTHLPVQCYLETEKVEYTEIDNESEEVAYEAVLINQIRPKYNSQFKDYGDFNIKIPQFCWNAFKWEYDGQLLWLKKKKMGVIKASDVISNCMVESDQQVALTGYLNIDSRMIMSSQSFTLIAGVSGAGKTDYLLNIAIENAMRGKNVFFINLKNSVEELAARLLSINSRISMKQIVQKQMSDQEWEILFESIKNGNSDKILFYNANQNYIALNSIISQIMANNVDLIIIDDIQMIEDEGNRYIKDRIDFVLKSIKILGVQLSVPILGAYCIPSRSVDSRQDHRPILSDLEYSGLLTYSDNIQLLYRDRMYYEDSEQKNVQEIIVAKNMLGDIFK